MLTLDAREQLAYRLWREARRLEDIGDREPATAFGRHRAAMWYGQSTGFQRAAWMVLASHGEVVDAQFFEKADAARLANITETA